MWVKGSLLLLVCSNAHATTSTFATKGALQSLRGGAGPLDPNTVAKVNTVLQLAQSGTLVLAPAKGAELYNLPTDSVHVHLSERMFTSLLSYGVLLYCVMYTNISLKEAAVWSCIPWAAHALKSLLNDAPTFLGVKDDPFILGLTAAVTWAVLSDMEFDVAKYMGIFVSACGVVVALQPSLGEQLWGINMASDSAKYIAKATGLFTLGEGIYLYLLATGEDPLKAMGYSMMTHLALVVSALFITKEVDKFKQDKGPLFAWMLEHCAVIGTLVL